MSLSESDREGIERKLAGSVSSDDKHEFMLHLYDKLWENIVNKENRLWTFLTVYGAGIGIILGTGMTESFRLPAGCLILVLTYWAMELIIDADWWSVRNRLMIGRIEKRFGGATKGIIPSFYHSPGYHGEGIHKASLLALALIGFFIFLNSLGYLDGSCFRERSMSRLLGVTALYGSAVLSLVRCLLCRERRIAEYHETRGDLVQDDPAEPRDGEVLRKDKKREGWHLRVIFAYIIATLTVGPIYWWHAPGWPFWVFVGFQVLVVVLYYRQRRQYLQGEKLYAFSIKSEGAERLTAWGICMLVAGVVSIIPPFLGAWAACLPWSPTAPRPSAEISRSRGQLDAIRSDLDAIEEPLLKRLKATETGMVDVRRKLDSLEKMSTDRLDLQRSELVEVRKTMKELRDRLDDLRARWEANGLPIKK